MIALLIGPPGSGKSTQAARLSRKCAIPHVEMGDLLRELAAKGTPQGREIKSYIERGLLVPEPIVEKLIADRLHQAQFRRGFILDGFPRNVSQAGTLDRMLADMHQKLDLAVLFEVPEDVVVERLSGRRLCPSCGASYHVKYSPPAHLSRCDMCGVSLRQRADDRPEIVRERLHVFLRETAPLVKFYEERGILHRIDASGTVDEVFAAVSPIAPCK